MQQQPDTSGNFIWRPHVEATQAPLPHPGGLSTSNSSYRQELYTKTSLAATRDNLNSRIMNSSQAFNNSPKPFIGSGSSHSYQPSIERMAPKLVPPQYNSPINLYSMNNICKAIEAHSETLSSGVKGINFLKSDSTANKESEVLKLIKEEEVQSRNQRQQGSASLSPISGQALTTPAAMALSRTQQQLHDSSSNSSYQATASSCSNLSKQSAPSGANPKCSECGRTIAGHFARLQDRFVHPQCLNCTTCGTSLKNVGFFTVNDKLYCEIHAKQVANMMRIQYDFSQNLINKQQQQQQHYYQQQVAVESDRGTYLAHPLSPSNQPKQSTAATELGSMYKQGSSSPATISTMFANIGGQQRDIGSGAPKLLPATWQPASTTNNLTGFVTPTPPPPPSVSQGYQSSLSTVNKTQEYTKMSHSSFKSGRVPICAHCHVQIQGPYILAGKSTWCKDCSQRHFNCSSCKQLLLETGFIEDDSQRYFCETCYDEYFTPLCAKCNTKIKGDCLSALGKRWHPTCFICGHCRRPFGNSSFYLEDNMPYCEPDWNKLFTTKCHQCSRPILAGDKWVEALDHNYHASCFKCTSCNSHLEGSTFYCKDGRPYCKLHVR